VRHYYECNCTSCGHAWQDPASTVHFHADPQRPDVDWEIPMRGVWSFYSALAHFRENFSLPCPKCGDCAACTTPYRSEFEDTGTVIRWEEKSVQSLERFVMRDLLAQLVCEWELLELHPRIAVGFHTEGLTHADQPPDRPPAARAA
jgi:hypothetical protein